MQRVSVIIPAYNHAGFLPEAIDSVLAQTLTAHEIIVVDDGSSDETPLVMAGYGDRIRAVSQPNRGVSAARNRGVELSSGELLAFLDADDVWLPRKLELEVGCLLAASDLGLVHCGVQEIDASGAVLCERLNGLEGSVATDLLLFRRPVILGGGSGVLIPRAVFDSVGGFDTRLSTSADWDVYYRIARSWRVGFVAEPLLQYRLHGSNMHGNVKAMEHDMLLAYAKAFEEADPPLLRLRRRCYGNLHAVLAGSFYSAGHRSEFVRHALRSALLTPDNLARFAAYPVRRWRRRASESSGGRSSETPREHAR